MIVIGAYLHMRVFICYTLSMNKAPISVAIRKRDKLNYERLRDQMIKVHKDELSESEINALRMYKSDFATLATSLKEINQTCKICDQVKPLRVKHCNTCEQCVIKMDHHCLWINNCIGLHNYIYVVQLLFHHAVGSLYYFLILWQLSYNPKIYYALMGGEPIFWWVFHLVLFSMTAFYCCFMLWLLYKDITTIEYMNLYTPEKFDSVEKYERHSLAFRLLLATGHTKLWKALIFPCTGLLPINGLEYENEKRQGRTSNYSTDNDLWKLN
ncbi:hypothetical protein FGO68_gene1190 [Halteria grandinella]|uniref:Palmitoyltransferase n=1 Tax=Halteria grandinella TaxID=5974 RepID=A0A8J8NMK4_HALGN|nr:hypothetical protein FGO68_gene1190 [Halteria grandinella]